MVDLLVLYLDKRREMGKINYRIGKLNEEEQFKFDFADGLSRSVNERIELGFIVMKLPVIDIRVYYLIGFLPETPYFSIII